MNFREKANLILKIAELLRGPYKQSEYGKVILPMTVLRRLDCVLAPTKESVLKKYEKHKDKSEEIRDKILNKAAGFPFHNHSKFDFNKLLDDPSNIEENLIDYINGFSKNIREIIMEKDKGFGFKDEIERLNAPNIDLLYKIVKEFSMVDLSDVDTIMMGYIFEELIRRFAEQSNDTAGEHFTPREVIKLMVNIITSFDDSIKKEGILKTIYDPACGTGGMLSVAEQHIKSINPNAKLKLFGQEINPESYATCKSDMLIKGEDAENIKLGDTLADDAFPNMKFDYMLCNPPFGVDWKSSQEDVKKEYEELGFSGRFGPGLPRISDGTLLFLLHMISKMKHDDGSKIAIIFNGSPLFTGNAGSGESNIRRWIIENDYLEAIIALPDQLFYNTGISTYIWILNNKKPKNRKGKIQLINATGKKDDELIEEGKLDKNRFYDKMARSLGDKRKYIPENGDDRGINFIAKLYKDFKENEFVKIYPNEFFGYWRVTVERPKWESEEIKKEAIEKLKKGIWKIEKGKLVKEDGSVIKLNADAELRDYENIPFLREEKGKLVKQTIEEYFEREVKPYVPDAWIDEKKTKIGYEINFTKYFYEFKPLRPVEEIREEILKLEEEIQELMKKALEEE